MDDYLTQIGERIRQLPAGGQMHPDTVRVVLLLLRHHLELVRTNAPITRHYANWTAHSALDRGLAPTLLDEAWNVFSTDQEQVNDCIIDLLRLRELRREILEILRHQPEVDAFHSHHFWKDFCSKMLGAIVNKPLKRTAPMQDPNARHAAQLTLRVLSASDIAALDQAYVIECDLRPGCIVWDVFVMPDGFNIRGPLCLPETEHDFRHP